MSSFSKLSRQETPAQHFLLRHPRYDLQTIDQGNSHPHVGYYQAGELTNVSPLSNLGLISHQETISSSVTQKEEHHPLDILWQGNVFCSMPVYYERDQLGSDRLYQAALAYHLYPGRNILLIDAGTFMTIDTITEQGFMGGYIYPGIDTFLSSYQKGKLLPTLSREYFPTKEAETLPSTTKEAILHASLLYIKSVLEHHCSSQEDTLVILTGGSSSSLAPYLQMASQEPHFIHHALYFLYHHKKQQESLQ